MLRLDFTETSCGAFAADRATRRSWLADRLFLLPPHPTHLRCFRHADAIAWANHHQNTASSWRTALAVLAIENRSAPLCSVTTSL